MTSGALARRLGTGDAIVLGLASMIGAGVFAVFAPAAVSRLLVAVTPASLAVIVAGIWLAPGRSTEPLEPTLPGGAYGVLQAAGLLFFAFAGYARIATLGEEVREPRRTIPRAILAALAIAVVVYAVVGCTALAAAGPEQLAASTAPLTDAALASGAAWLVPVVQLGAVVACLGALLTLMAGIGRTRLAMARNSDLPRWLADVHPKFATPHHAELVLAAAVGAVVLFGDTRGAIGFSSFGCWSTTRSRTPQLSPNRPRSAGGRCG